MDDSKQIGTDGGLPKVAADDPARVKRWIEGIAREDQRVFQEIYREYKARLYSYALYQLRNAADAQEIAQDTLLGVWRQAASFREESNFSTWVYSIAKNKIVDKIRARQSKKAKLLEPVESYDEYADPNSNPETHTETAELRRHIVQCLEPLSDEKQQCIFFAYFDGRTVEDIAEKLKTAVGNVKRWLREARLALEPCLKAKGILSW